MYKISNARTCENNSKMFYFYVQYLFATLHRISFIRLSVRDFLSGSLNFHPIKSFKIFILYYTILIFIFIFFWDNPIRIYIYIYIFQDHLYLIFSDWERRGEKLWNIQQKIGRLISSPFNLSQLFSICDVTRFSKRLRFTSESHFRRFRKSGCQPKGDCN